MKILHFTIPSPVGNFGDDVLFYCVKQQIESIFADRKVEWINYPLRNHTTWSVVEKANSCDLVLVGGGGLMLKDTNPNTVSGWQWACSLEHLRAIRTPIVVYAIGHNRFRGQEDFDSIFVEHVGTLIDKASLFSVRNHGSRRALMNYGFSGDKIQVVPCPSIFFDTDTYPHEARRLGFNLAGDRRDLRGVNKHFYDELQYAVSTLFNSGWEIHFINHNWNPSSNCQDFVDCLTIPCTVHNLDTVWDHSDLRGGVNVYRGMDVVIAMRGHGQMIPFGQAVPTVSLISHDKLLWFLEDMDMIDTGIDITCNNLGESLVQLVVQANENAEWKERQAEAVAAAKARVDATAHLAIRRLVP